ncbi:MAG: erythromycin biosynthesis sensory transduction protein eryC1 [Verrucomicrobiales bacterium]|nr:erythromycin biosynthesis sensory transduction protein eryC1 [Verrucomicrobiales bacterium]|tara:strand:+ start:2068 stop:3171 length:1104 start_codon:yes stop_codon:yes gene_type:complete
MNVPFVDLHRQYVELKDELDAAIAEVIAGSDFIRGRHMEPFEEEFSTVLGARHCVSCGNGTDALYIALRALGAGSGDEVITTAHSWISTSETITQTGARVVFCDTEERTFNLDAEAVRDKITDRTRGIVVVHLCGQSADVDVIREIADEHGLWVVEDCAQAHLATLRGQRVGTFGDVAAFSFYPGKNLGAMGDAGAVVTNREDLADWMRLFARHGGKGEHVIEGINSRMDGLQAAVLRVKLPHLEEWTRQRRAAAEIYDELLAGVERVEIPHVAPNREHVYHLYMIRVERRDELRSYLKERHVATGVNYGRALPFYSAYKYLGHTPADFPHAHANQERVLSLPIFPEITREEQEYVAGCVREGTARG